MNKFEDGVHDISNDEYHSSEGISRSKLMLLDKSPYHFWYEVLSGEAEHKEATPDMLIGSLFHTLLLEPEKFDKEYAMLPKVDRRTAQGKALYEEFLTFSDGKIIIKEEQYDKAKTMADLMRKHEIVDTLLDESKFEQSIYWTDKETGLQFKARPDIWSTKMVVDVKTTQDASLRGFTNSAYKYGYYLQAGMLYEACKAVGKPFEMFVILTCEKTAPHAPGVYIMNDAAIQFGLDQFEAYKKKLKECLDKDKWPGYPVQELGIPSYAQVEEE